MFVGAGKTKKIYVNEKGRIKDPSYVTMQPQEDADGYLYVVVNRIKYYIHELVLQNHGIPPHKNRLQKEDEVIVFLDGDIKNVSINNLEYSKNTKDKTTQIIKELSEDTKAYIWNLLTIQGLTYTAIQEKVAQSTYSEKTVSIQQIQSVKKEFLAKYGTVMSSAEKNGLNASTNASEGLSENYKREAFERGELKGNPSITSKPKDHEPVDPEPVEKEEESEEKAQEQEEKVLDQPPVADAPSREVVVIDKGRGWFNIEIDGVLQKEHEDDDKPKNFRELQAHKVAKRLQSNNETLAEALLEV